MQQDVFKLLKDLELKAVGLDPETQKMQEGYFVAFRSLGLPVHKEDYYRPWSPSAASVPPAPPTPPVDPAAGAPGTASAGLDPEKIQVSNIANAQQAFLNTFLLVDDKLEMNADYAVMPGSSKLSDSWFAIVNGANGVASRQELNDEMKAAYAAAMAKLQTPAGDPTPHYEAYMRYADEYRIKVRALDKLYADSITNPDKLQAFPVVSNSYYEDKVDAMQRWSALGHKEEIEKALNTLAAQGNDPAMLLINRSKEKFRTALMNFMGVGQIPYTLLSPASWCDVDNDDGWTEYTMKDLHNQTHYEASTTAYGGGAAARGGLWSAGGKFEHSDKKEAGTSAMQNTTITLKYCVVDIRRPWLDLSLLNLPNWFIMGDYKKNCISTGKMAQELPPGNLEPTFLPSVVTSLILVKDVRIKWDDWKQEWQNHKTSTSGSASVGVFCFTAEAHYSRGKETRDFKSDDTGEELVIPGIQLVGYVSTINPAAPRLDSAAYMQPVKGHEDTPA